MEKADKFFSLNLKIYYIVSIPLQWISFFSSRKKGQTQFWIDWLYSWKSGCENSILNLEKKRYVVFFISLEQIET